MSPPSDTIPAPPPSELTPVVAAGQARVAVLQALGEVAGAIGRLEALAVGIARQLDATTTTEGGAR